MVTAQHNCASPDLEYLEYELDLPNLHINTCWGHELRLDLRLERGSPAGDRSHQMQHNICPHVHVYLVCQDAMQEEASIHYGRPEPAYKARIQFQADCKYHISPARPPLPLPLNNPQTPQIHSHMLLFGVQLLYS